MSDYRWYVVANWRTRMIIYQGRKEFPALLAWEPGTVLGYGEDETTALAMVARYVDKAQRHCGERFTIGY